MILLTTWMSIGLNENWIKNVCGSGFVLYRKGNGLCFEKFLFDITEVLVRVTENMQVYFWCMYNQLVHFIMWSMPCKISFSL